MANQQPPYGFAGPGNAPYPTNTQPGYPPYPVSDNPPPYPTNTNPPYNPSFVQAGDKPYATTPLMPQNPPPLNAPQYAYNPPPVQYGVPQHPPPNITALNSVPNRNVYAGTTYGPGWYRYSPANRKRILIIFGICSGIFITIFIIVFVTITVQAQRDHDAFREKHFGH